MNEGSTGGHGIHFKLNLTMLTPSVSSQISSWLGTVSLASPGKMNQVRV